MTDVFISYSRKDTEFVRRLFEGLKARGRDAWVDWQGIDYSTKWWEEICAGIEGGDNFVLILSPDALNSVYCHREIEYARQHNKRMIPFIYRPIDEKELIGGWYTHSEMRAYETLARENWETLKSIQYIDYPGKLTSDFDRALNVLLATVDTDPQRVRLHTRLSLRVRDWESRGRSPSALLRGDELAAYENWLLKTDAANDEPRATDSHRLYITQSRRVENQLRFEAEQQERRTKALEAQTKSATAENARLVKSRRRSLNVAIVLAVIGIIAILATIAAVRTGNDLQGQYSNLQTQAADAKNAISDLGGLQLTPLAMMTLLPTQSQWDFAANWKPTSSLINGIEMLLIPPGCFTIAFKSEQSEQPSYKQCWDEPFWVDTSLVSEENFKKLTGSLPVNRQDRSVVNLPPIISFTWSEARNYCQLRDARLPTEIELAYAAHGPGDQTARPAGLVAPPSGKTIPIAASWNGIFLANEWEWTSTIYDPQRFPDPYRSDDGREDPSDTKAQRVQLGAGWPQALDYSSPHRRGDYANIVPDLTDIANSHAMTDFGVSIGFRCVRDFK